MLRYSARLLIIFSVVFFICPSYSVSSTSEPSNLFELSLEELLDISIVTASKKSEKISDVPASVVVCTRDEISKLGYQTLSDVIENIPSVYTIKTRSWEGQPFGIRGFVSGEPKNLIVLVNGVNQIEGVRNFYSIETFPVPVESIERIEVIRGPMSVLYGPGAFFGVINIITNEFLKDESFSYSFSGGSQYTRQLSFQFKKKTKDLTISMNGGFYSTDGPDQPIKDMISDSSILPSLGINNLNRTTKKLLEKDSRYIDFSLKYKNFFTNINLGNIQDEVFVVFPSVGNGLDQDITVSKVQFGYKNSYDRFSYIGKITAHKKWSHLDVDWLDPLYSGVQPTYADGFEGEFVLNGNFSNSLIGTFGLYNQTWNNAYSFYTVPQLGLYGTEYGLDNGTKLKQYAVFSQFEYTPHPKFSFIAGGRFDKVLKYDVFHLENGGLDSIITPTDTLHQIYEQFSYDRDKIDFIPRLAMIYRINSNSIMKFLYGRAINRPSLFQIVINRKKLAPEYIETYELNYISILSRYLSTNISFFRNTMENLIVRRFYVTGNGNLIQDYSNTGKIQNHGAEVAFYYDPVDILSVTGSFTWQYAEDKRDGFENRDVEYSPELIWSLKTTYRLSENFYFSLSGKYMDEMETHWDVTLQNDDGSFGRRIGDRSKASFILDANLHISKLLKDGYYGNLRISNLLDNDTLYPTYVDNTWGDKGMIRDGRMFYITVGKEF